MNIREAGLSDIQYLRELEQRVIEAERPYNSTIKSENTRYYDIESLISDTNSFLLVVEENSTIIGTGYAQIRQSKTSLSHVVHSYLGFMYVTPDFRGRGVNKKIIDHLISWSKNKGVRDLYLDVYSGNTTAIKAYEKVGFKSSLTEMKLGV